MNPFVWFCPLLGLLEPFFDFPTRWWHCLEHGQRSVPGGYGRSTPLHR